MNPSVGHGMRVLVSEYLCGGHWPEPGWPPSLLMEGRAMLEAVLQDLLAVPDVCVMTTWDRRLRLPDPSLFRTPSDQRVHFECVDSPEQAITTLQKFARTADAALIIAPEFDGLLERQCRILEGSLRLLNCAPDAIRQCADKFSVFQICCAAGIPTIPTKLIQNDVPRWRPSVVKRRDGAGSLDMVLLTDRAAWHRWQAEAAVEQFIEQPFFPGTACSLTAFFHRGSPCWFLPVALQHLSEDGRFRYLGGTVPAPEIKPERLHQSIAAFAQAVPGLQGAVGFDFLIPDSSGSPLLVDVNPRLCTSYVGYRRICRDNLSAWLIQPDRTPAPRFEGAITFSADGTSCASAACFEVSSFNPVEAALRQSSTFSQAHAGCAESGQNVE